MTLKQIFKYNEFHEYRISHLRKNDTSIETDTKFNLSDTKTIDVISVNISNSSKSEFNSMSVYARIIDDEVHVWSDDCDFKVEVLMYHVLETVVLEEGQEGIVIEGIYKNSMYVKLTHSHAISMKYNKYEKLSFNILFDGDKKQTLVHLLVNVKNNRATIMTSNKDISIKFFIV